MKIPQLKPKCPICGEDFETPREALEHGRERHKTPRLDAKPELVTGLQERWG